jgi:SAM-dependent methyltransferase
VDAAFIAATTAAEDRHWWYRERRAIIERELRRLGPPGQAIEIGAAGGGNCRTLTAHGWDVLATEFVTAGVTIAKSRGINTIQADARRLPLPAAAFDLLVAFDVLEHIDEDDMAAAEIMRVLRPGGVALIAVPCDMDLWSAHDVLNNHFRRYDRDGLTKVVQGAGLVIDALWSWNVLLRPIVKMRRNGSSQADNERDISAVNPLVNAALNAIVRVERHLPVKSWPGVSLMMRAHRPNQPHIAPT